MAVGVPRFDGPSLPVEGVFASTATAAWNKATHRVCARVSIVAQGDVDLDWTSRRGGGIQAADCVLVAADLLPEAEDRDAGVTEARPDLTDAEAEVQRRLDAYIADPAGPLGVDFHDRSRTLGVAALEPLRQMDQPLLEQEAVGAA